MAKFNAYELSALAEQGTTLNEDEEAEVARLFAELKQWWEVPMASKPFRAEDPFAMCHVAQFLDRIEGHGYGGGADYEFARQAAHDMARPLGGENDA